MLLANTPAQAQTLLHSLEWAAAGIGLHVNAHMMEHICFNQSGNISTQNGSSLKLVDKFTYLGNNVSSCTATYHPSQKLFKLDEPDMRDTAGEVRTNP